MAFNTFTFIVFFLAVLGLCRLPLGWSAKKAILLLASYLFYAAWNPPFIVILWFSTVVDWIAARRIHACQTAGRTAGRRAWLIVSLAANLGLLAYFKYGGFILDNSLALLRAIGINHQPPEWSVVLPMGISFYTFQTLSYTIDIYRGHARPARSFLDYALYVTFFPQLVAGPIVRAADFLPQCTEPRRATPQQLGWGFILMTIGIFQKNLLADRLFAPVADQVFAAARDAGFVDAWAGTLAFAGQIFCDFSGYSLCGIGAALCLGFELQDNFRYPYAAIGFSDFWRRWHISLSSWLRDYLYIPLGGNRRGVAIRTRNLFATMLLGGLWHGAAWTFVAWGALHGLLLVAEAAGKRLLGGLPVWRTRPARLALAGATFLAVCLTWTLFRAADLGSAWAMLAAMLAPGPLETALSKRSLLAVAGVGALVAAHWVLRDTSLEQLAAKAPPWLVSAAVALMTFLVLTTSEQTRGFIYFQF